MIDLIGTLRRIYTRLGAPAGASMSVDIAALQTALTALGLQYIEGSVSDAGPAAADFDTDLTEATDDHYNGMLLMFTDGDNAGQAHVIDDYAAANGNCAFSAEDRWTDVPGDGDNFIILPAVGEMTKAIYSRIGAPAATVSADIAVIDGFHDVPGADAATNAQIRDVVGNKTDTALEAYTAADSLMRYIKGLLDKNARVLCSMDFWSDVVEEVAVTGAKATVTITGGNVVVAEVPGTIVRAVVMMKFRMVENTHATIVNKLDATDPLPMQVDDSGDTGWFTCINFVDDAFTLAAVTREGGDVIIGDVDVAARVDGNDTYDFQWLDAKADQNNLQFNDVQMGIRVWYSI